ncbi:MAG: FISUMP domain-containing protein [Flavobacteriales bacterium]
MKTTLAALLLLSLCSSLALNDITTFIDQRDQNQYHYIELNGLNWMTENLRYNTEASMCVNEESDKCFSCGEFYLVEEALSICPVGWRLPTEKEVKGIIKLDKKKKIDLKELLNIDLCGRIDKRMHGRLGEQNVFWVNAPLKDGIIAHWHITAEEQHVHSHNVVNAERQFPVRCVCELD